MYSVRYLVSIVNCSQLGVQCPLRCVQYPVRLSKSHFFGAIRIVWIIFFLRGEMHKKCHKNIKLCQTVTNDSGQAFPVSCSLVTNFAQILRHFVQSCICMIVTFINSGTWLWMLAALTCNLWHAICDPQHVICDTYHVTRDTWHMTTEFIDMWHIPCYTWHLTHDNWIYCIGATIGTRQEIQCLLYAWFFLCMLHLEKK